MNRIGVPALVAVVATVATLGALGSLAACWRSSSPPPASGPPAAPSPSRRTRVEPPSPVDVMFETFQRFTEDMCACHDATCAQGVVDDMTKWAQERASDQGEPAKMTDAETSRMAEIGERMGRCMHAAMSAGQGSATPQGTATP